MNEITETKQGYIKSALLIQITKLVKEYPNDMELGKHIRLTIKEAEEKLNRLNKKA